MCKHDWTNSFPVMPKSSAAKECVQIEVIMCNTAASQQDGHRYAHFKTAHRAKTG